MPEPTTQAKLEEQFVTEAIPVGLPWRLLIFSIIIFAFSIIIYFGLTYGYETYLDKQAGALDQKINQLTSQVNQKDQQNFINFYSQLINLKTVLSNHDFSSNVFNFLERNTLGSVYFTQANFTLDGYALDLSGQVSSINALVQQLNIFDKAPELASVTLNQTNFDPKGNVSFSVNLIFNDNAFSEPAS